MTDPYLPAEERRVILRDYGRRYGLRVFVETGTANGDTPAALMGDFDWLYTIEIDPRLFLDARARFTGSNVTCFHGDSTDVLATLLDADRDVPALFWLDGHACGGARGVKDTPIMEELAVIFRCKARHVILIDDARLFRGMPYYGEWDWPHIDEIAAAAAAAGYDMDIADDIIRLVPEERRGDAG